MKSMPGLPKLVQHLADYVAVFGIEVESGLTQSWKSTKLWCCKTPLYACETWTVYQRHAKKLNHFHTSCLRKLLKIKWQDRIPDKEVLKRAGMQSIHTLLKLAQLRWTGHVTRMHEERLPRKILYGELEIGKHPHCGQKKPQILGVSRAVQAPKNINTKTPWKPPSRISTYQQSHGNKLHMAEQSGEA